MWKTVLSAAIRWKSLFTSTAMETHLPIAVRSKIATESKKNRFESSLVGEHRKWFCVATREDLNVFCAKEYDRQSPVEPQQQGDQ